MFFKKRKSVNNISVQKSNIDEICVEFCRWVQDNYSQNRKGNTMDMLPVGFMRKDFTDEIFTIKEIFEEFKKGLANS